MEVDRLAGHLVDAVSAHGETSYALSYLGEMIAKTNEDVDLTALLAEARAYGAAQVAEDAEDAS